jgi:hypothetical protein
VDEVHDLTKIDKWFLVQIEEIVKIELELDQLVAEKATDAGFAGCRHAAHTQEEGLFRPPAGQAAQDHRKGGARSPPAR